jgi:hypothetical protein
MEVIEMQTSAAHAPQIHRLRICQDGQGSYSMLFTHTGQFNLKDYEEVEMEVVGTRLVSRV